MQKRTASAAVRCAKGCVGVLLVWPCIGNAIDIATDIPDLTVKWDNTLKYSAAYRLRNPSATLTSAAENTGNVNQDDGDRNFNRGVISNRLDLLSEFDLAYKSVGLRLTAAGWYDSVYNGQNDNPGFPGGAYPNQTSTAANNFVERTRQVHGRHAEVLDAFVFGSFETGKAGRASVRLGQHGMVWGETFFFGTNGIAGGMMPVDVVKLVSVPNTQFKEAIRPVPMISGQWQPVAGTTLGAYYQFRWAKSRIPTVGSYFSFADVVPDGAERLLVSGGGSPFLDEAPRLDDVQPRNSGQGGLQLRTRAGAFDLGAYLIRFHDKAPQPVIDIGAARVAYVPTVGCPIPGSFPTGPTSCALPGPVSYRLVYAEDITSLGFSASRTFGDVNIATEASIRWNQPLTSGLSSDVSALTGAPRTDNQSNPGYATGKTAHVNVSAIWSINPNSLFREGNVVAEIAWNRLLSVRRNPQLLDPASTRDAVAIRALFQPTYRQIVPGLDLAPVVGIGWAPKGSRSAITATTLPQNGTGDVTLGVDATWRDEWRASLAYTHYLGTSGGFLVPVGNGNSSLNYRQVYGDRDFIALSVRRSF